MSNFLVATGSRSFVLEPNSLVMYQAVEKWILDYKKRLTDTDSEAQLWCVVGGAEGWDECIAKVCMRNSIPYTMALPNKGFGKHYWQEKPQLRLANDTNNARRYQTFLDLLNSAAEVHYVCNDIYKNGVHSNFLRNQWMIDYAMNDDFCDSAEGIVYMPEMRGGTKDCVTRMQRAKMPYWFFNKTTMEFTQS